MGSLPRAVFSRVPARHLVNNPRARDLLQSQKRPRVPMARFAVFAVLFLLITAPVRAQAQPAQDFERLFARALELQQAGDVLGAIDTYKAALTISPDRGDALSNLGAAYVRLGQYDDAIKQLRGGAEGRIR